MDIKTINKEYLDEIENKLPAALSEKRKNDLINRALDNDKNAKKELLENNIELVLKVVKEYEDEFFYAEDLVSIGTIGLIKAINSYSKDVSIQFMEYVTNSIREEIKIFISKISC